jgi:catechol 2,3-dioxygenase-like lactoylglutathione lyase family enzyme
LEGSVAWGRFNQLAHGEIEPRKNAAAGKIARPTFWWYGFDGGAMSDVHFGGVTPVFRVADAAASEAYYVDKLGFKVNWRTPGFISVSREKCTIFLCESDQGHFGTWVWIGVPDAEAACEYFRARGAKVRHPPTNYEWALEMQLEDLDGNVLRLGSEANKGEPIGEWLDMNGVRWAPKSGAQA